MFPTFRPNGDLYFSCNGHIGMGGLDIYIARIDEKTQQYKIEHPGYPLNSEADDFGMTFEDRTTVASSLPTERMAAATTISILSKIRRLSPR